MFILPFSSGVLPKDLQGGQASGPGRLIGLPQIGSEKENSNTGSKTKPSLARTFEVALRTL
jgi:hypothetical protein